MSGEISRGKLLYHNPLASPEDVAGFRLEGQADITFDEGRMRLNSVLDPALGQKANYVYWCPEVFPPDVWIEWQFWPGAERGLCILFWSASGRNGEDLFDPGLPVRDGPYSQYHSGALNAFHISYYRRRFPNSGRFSICNLRKSYGHHVVAAGPDPMPQAQYAQPPYTLRAVRCGARVTFHVEEFKILEFVDDGVTYGPLLGGGRIGFRQMAEMTGDYAHLRVYEAIG